MKVIIIFLGKVFFTQFCQSQNAKVEIEQIYKNEISIRAFVLEGNKIYFSGNKNRVGYIDIKTKITRVIEVRKDFLAIEFRGIAQTKSNLFVLSVGSPALLYKIDKKTFLPELVYTENHEMVFYDGIQFSDNNNGIAFGDPIDGRFSIITTDDGGNTWKKLAPESSPLANKNEAAFAASNSTLVVKKSNVWIATGGQSARIFKSKNYGKEWQVFASPIVQGDSMTGIFSMAFADSKNGFIVGGNFEKPSDRSKNKAKTIDGGKTWNLQADKRDYGYASCVNIEKYSKGKRLVTVGADGVFLSNDFGESWIQIAKDKDLHICKFLNYSTIIAAGKNKIISINFQNL